jgi:predicted small integral membrane protein
MMTSQSGNDERKPGFLPIETNWFDRLFISIVIWVALSLFWMRFIEPFGPSVWFAAAISAVLGAYVVWKG